jgi:hypothetical protein
MSDSNALTTTSTAGPLSYLTEANSFEHIWRVATAFSKSALVPPHFHGKPENTFVALQMALQLEVNPLLALQNIIVIQGRPGFNAQFAIALCNQRGPFRGPITWETSGKGKELEVKAKGVLRVTGETVEVTVSMATAELEGWTKNPKYRSMPEQMLRYRSATWLIRLYAPDVLLGFSTNDELEDVTMTRVKVEQPGNEPVIVAELNSRIAKTSGTPADSLSTVEVGEATKTETVEISAPDDDPFADGGT